MQSDFYCGTDVVKIARSLLGKFLVTKLDGYLTSGIIVETEAYSWCERGCHAYQGRKTARNNVMFEQGGVSYVYLCYGMYELFNVVTNREGVAEAVLIRALEPIDGQSIMLARCNTSKINRITSGPGKLTRAMGISRMENGINLTANKIWIEDRGLKVKRSEIAASARIGLNSKYSDSALPWRFVVNGNLWVRK